MMVVIVHMVMVMVMVMMVVMGLQATVKVYAPWPHPALEARLWEQLLKSCQDSDVSLAGMTDF
jgi:hypothetical protein